MLHLDLGGLELQLKINQFREDLHGESEYDNWCYMDFSVMRNGVDIYHNHKNYPWLTCDEIKEIRDTISGVMGGSITENKHLGFIEPDIEFEFIFYDGKFSNVDMILGYWETGGVFTANRLVLCLGLYELERILCYLQYKTTVTENKENVWQSFFKNKRQDIFTPRGNTVVQTNIKNPRM